MAYSRRRRRNYRNRNRYKLSGSRRGARRMKRLRYYRPTRGGIRL